MKKIIQWFYYFEKFIDRWWYCPILGFIAAIDHYVILFPILGMMISSIFLQPRKWFSITIWCAFGSWFGALCLAFIARYYGLAYIELHFPQMLQSPMWDWAHDFFFHHGIWLVFLLGMAPLPQQPPVIIAALAGTPLTEIAVVLLVARLIKFIFIGYLASHAPQRLKLFSGLRKELDELHVETPASL